MISLHLCSTTNDTFGSGMTFVIGSQTGGVGAPYNDVLGLKTILGAFIAVEFDISQEDAVGDPNDNHIGLDVNSAVSQVTADPPFQMVSELPFTVWVDYDGVTNSFQVYMAQSSDSKPTAPTLSTTWNFSTTLKPDNASSEYLMGFTSATGDVDVETAQMNVMSWCYSAGQCGHRMLFPCMFFYCFCLC